ncbi:MAG: TonB-dependent receptor [Thermodesulfobacteriota bacterium]|nr:TonB-dependent receptor [Thermodesulfobacteriota bacterium]
MIQLKYECTLSLWFLAFFLCMTFFSFTHSFAETITITALEEICVTATRTEKDPHYIPTTVYSITREALHNEKVVRTVPEALKEIPGVMIQKTSHGQGSPFIRGFTGFRTLFMVDGIRLNNSVFREGPNQYWNTVDPLLLDKLDIVKGPSSVLYGSDAVGGVVNAFTKGPTFGNEGYSHAGRVYYRYANAEDSHVGRGEIGGSFDAKLGWILGISYKDFGDVEGGKTIGTQFKTGYNEFDGDLKLEYTLDTDSKVVFAHQNVNQDDAWRTHKTIYGISWEGTTVGNEKRRTLDQTRRLTYLAYQGKNRGAFVDNLKLTFSYHMQEEEQFRIRNDDRFDIQGFDVGTVGTCVQIDTHTFLGTWTYGLEYYHDEVSSFLRKYNADGTLNTVEVQGPVADDASYDLLGVFIQDDIALCDSFDAILGLRYTYAKADAQRVRNPQDGSVMSISDSWGTVVGSFRALYHVDTQNHYKIFCGISQGFRAPNLSDLTRFDTARSNEIETAAPYLDPEKFITYETGVKTRHDCYIAQLAYFYTYIEDMIVRTPTGIIIDGDNEVTKKNSGNGFIHGIELNAEWNFLPQFTALGSFSWLEGEVDTFPTSSPQIVKEPISRLMPATGHVGIRWNSCKKNWWVEGLVTIADTQDKLSTRDKSDMQRIPPGGTPGYTIYSLRGGWKINESTVISTAIENITNKDYRIHGSGQNEPGTNFLISLEYTF